MIRELRERFRGWLHRDCRTRLDWVNALAAVSARLSELGKYCHDLTAAVVDQPAHVTVLVIGCKPETIGAGHGYEGAGRGAPIIYATAARVGRRGAELINVEIHQPIVDCCVVVLADLERVDVRAIFRGTDVVTMAGPVGFFAEIRPGELVRVSAELREAVPR